MSDIPADHPRYRSLITRERIVEGVELGITSMQGLVAHGRGECFDYLLGEDTTPSARVAEKVAVALLLLAQKPVISVNGNAAALAPSAMVELSRILEAPLEVNLFHRTEERVQRIIEHLGAYGALEVMGSKGVPLLELEHSRAIVEPEGIYVADVVLVPLEDGDRCQALVNMGKKVITIDLNPLSRTSRTATIPIVDNMVRAMENMISLAQGMNDYSEEQLRAIVEGYDRQKTLSEALREIVVHLGSIS